jgi:hypothetical protein
MNRDQSRSQEHKFPSGQQYDSYDHARRGSNLSTGGGAEADAGRGEQYEQGGSSASGVDTLGIPRSRQRIDSVSPSLPQLPLNEGEGLGFDLSSLMSMASSAEGDESKSEE